MDRYLRHPSRPAQWSGTDLEPVESPLLPEVEVWAGWTEDDTKIWEALNAIPIADEDTVQLTSVPAYAYGLNYGDTVACVTSAEGSLVISQVRSPSDQTTFRIWLGADPDTSAWRPITESYAKRGCVVDVLTASLIALSCAIEDSDTIQRMLEEDAVRAGLVWEPGTPTT